MTNSNEDEPIWCGFSEQSSELRQRGRQYAHPLVKHLYAILTYFRNNFEQHKVDTRIAKMEEKFRKLQSKKFRLIEQETNIVVKGLRLDFRTATRVAGLLNEKLPLELRDFIYRYYWETFKLCWLRNELSFPALQYQVGLMMGKQFFVCPRLDCDRDFSSRIHRLEHVTQFHLLHVGYTNLIDNILLTKSYVGYATAHEAARMAYSVAGCAFSLPGLPARSGKGRRTCEDDGFAMGNLSNSLHQDPLRLNVVILDHVSSICIDIVDQGYLYCPKPPQLARPRDTLKGIFVYGAGRKVEIHVGTYCLYRLRDTRWFLEDLKRIYRALAPPEASFLLKIVPAAPGRKEQQALLSLDRLYQRPGDDWEREVNNLLREPD
ncbi:hypothetical protein BU23DRAFT_571454 [Bimuria novae-zelandiae CBS 107.79]|uniref:C2H2-type domain-containing protein n=1 Tax=Bimuria novae-zelandiae CBS 107.79 TaxID=1447943 RepID=A0A6A5UWG9_9PLEO|nr:hypothetical protein BU23DRAFT_571454 [Bimuria novae-zelandiae CBS 107.79]